ncbi:hypothetical protein ABI_01050 [Asticcacaulis biprosthecium C19]|uniref:Uncharacterized protein n=1 Tax=Asticcacaulis biprosthecium C19 TaxID=715226 RepID=F4QG62_9CAUL|nr:hypothetical protein ABI_01050 [Asticcacaulis biprosthecium C19]
MSRTVTPKRQELGNALDREPRSRARRMKRNVCTSWPEYTR